ncbi:MAG: hypothetical protein J6K17_09520 [Oscillospiraceae bacterium]|nr:hypothetical protein [Oscillospiraceae bacterium]
MSVLSLFDCYCSIDEGFELAGYDVNTQISNAIGIVGPHNRRLVNCIKALQPLFWVGVSDHIKKMDIDGYIITAHFSTPAEYRCSRPITWAIGVRDNNALNIPFEFPSAIHHTFDDDIHPDTALSLAIACNISEAIDNMAVMTDYEQYYGFLAFNEYV